MLLIFRFQDSRIFWYLSGGISADRKPTTTALLHDKILVTNKEFKFNIAQVKYNSINVTISKAKNIISFCEIYTVEKCPNTEFFLVCTFPYSDWIQQNTNQKKLLIRTHFTQWYLPLFFEVAHTILKTFSWYGGCFCENWKPRLLPRFTYNWSTFSRWVKARWCCQWAKMQVPTNQNSRNRWYQIVRGTVWIMDYS